MVGSAEKWLDMIDKGVPNGKLERTILKTGACACADSDTVRRC